MLSLNRTLPPKLYQGGAQQIQIYESIQFDQRKQLCLRIQEITSHLEKLMKSSAPSKEYAQSQIWLEQQNKSDSKYQHVVLRANQYVASFQAYIDDYNHFFVQKLQSTFSNDSNPYSLISKDKSFFLKTQSNSSSIACAQQNTCDSDSCIIIPNTENQNNFIPNHLTQFNQASSLDKMTIPCKKTLHFQENQSKSNQIEYIEVEQDHIFHTNQKNQLQIDNQGGILQPKYANKCGSNKYQLKLLLDKMISQLEEFDQLLYHLKTYKHNYPFTKEGENNPLFDVQHAVKSQISKCIDFLQIHTSSIEILIEFIEDQFFYFPQSSSLDRNFEFKLKKKLKINQAEMYNRNTNHDSYIFSLKALYSPHSIYTENITIKDQQVTPIGQCHDTFYENSKSFYDKFQQEIKESKLNPTQLIKNNENLLKLFQSI